MAPKSNVKAPYPTIHRFDGTDSILPVDDWIEFFEVQCDPAHDKASVFSLYCEPKIFQALKSAKISMVAGSWDTIKKFLLDHYLIPRNQVSITAQLMHRKQLYGERVVSFALAFEDLARQAKVEANALIGMFIIALRDEISGPLRHKSYDDLKSVIIEASNIENNLMLHAPGQLMAPSEVTPQQSSMNTIADDQSSSTEVPGHSSSMSGNRRFLESKPQRRFHPYVDNRRTLRPNTTRNFREFKERCVHCRRTNHASKDCYYQQRQVSFHGHANIVQSRTILGPTLLAMTFKFNGVNIPSCLIDTGANGSFIRETMLTKLKGVKRLQPSQVRFQVGNEQPLHHSAEVLLNVSSKNNPSINTHRFFVTDTLPFDVIIGTDILSSWDVTINTRRSMMIFANGTTEKLGKTETNIITPNPDEQLFPIETWMNTMQALSEDVDPRQSTVSKETAKIPTVSKDAPAMAQNRIKILTNKFSSVFDDPVGTSPSTFTKFKVTTVSDAIPFAARPFRSSHSERKIVDDTIREQLKNGWLIPANPELSEWAAPVFVVHQEKKDRLVFDYRRLNQATVKDSFPAPLIEDCFERLAGCCYFTLCDANQAYHQVLLDESTRHLLNVVTHDGIFTPTVLPFGPCNAPAHFQRNIQFLVKDIPDTFAYLDDIMIASKSLEQHLMSIEMLLRKCEEVNLKLKPGKCSFANSSIRYLGYIVDSKGRHIDEEKLTPLLRTSPPESQKQLRRFLGMCGFYQRFIYGYADICSVFYDLLSKSKKFDWTHAHQEAFNKLKTSMTTAPVLAHFDPRRKMEVVTDASAVAIAGVLQQRDDDGEPHPIMYVSRKLKQTETRYHAQELECLAVVFALKQFRHFLYGYHFLLISDHKSLKQVLNKATPSARITRWSLALQEFDYQVSHIEGKRNVVADYLSRPALMSITNSTQERKFETLWNPDIWRLHQASDAFCNSLKHTLAMTKSRHGFFEEDGMYLQEHAPGEARVVVPRTLIPEVLALMHAHPSAGHPGIRRTMKRVEQEFFWPNWRKDVVAYVNSCKSCQEAKGPRLQRPNKPICSEGPNYLVAMDIIGPLQQTISGNVYILTIQDHFTKFVVVCALTDSKAVTVAKAFINQWVAVFGAPFKLLTDNGQNFNSQFMHDVFAELGIHKMWTSPYRPQTDGSVERMNGTVMKMLSHFTNTTHTNWDANLSIMALAYNITYNATVDATPYFLQFSRTPPSLSDLLCRRKHNIEATTLSSAISAAHEAILKTNTRRMREYSRLSQQMQVPKYTLGEEVLFLNHTETGLSNKLRRRWTGPATIEEVRGELAYAINFRGNKYRVHVDHLKRIYKHPILNSDTAFQGSNPEKESKAKIKTPAKKLNA
jgi:transposase InsO family protein